MCVDPLEFEWLEPPEPAAVRCAIEELILLGALDHRQDLTVFGYLISDLQIDPGIGRMIYAACAKGLGKLNPFFNHSWKLTFSFHDLTRNR